MIGKQIVYNINTQIKDTKDKTQKEHNFFWVVVVGRSLKAKIGGVLYFDYSDMATLP